MKAKSIYLRLLALIIWVSMGATAFAQFSGGGAGTAADPFKIKTADDLNNVRNHIGAANADRHFRLMNDIDLTTFLQSNTAGWQPVGDGNNRFTGCFHGGGHAIKGLWINRSAIAYVALFGSNSGTIDSLAVEVSSQNITGGNYTAGLVGDNSGRINQCSATGGTISTTGTYSGGLIANNTGTVSNCYATGSSSASSSSYSYSGGLIGNNTGAINNCYATGSSSASSSSYSSSYPSSYSGGLIGNNTGAINNCYATGSSSASSSSYSYYSGGFIGYLKGGKVTNCYVTGSGNNKGAFVGYCENADYLSQCYYNSDIAGALSGVGGYGGSNVLGINTAGMKLQTTYRNWDFNYIWGIKENTGYPYLYDALPVGMPDVIRGKGTVCANSTETYIADEGKTGYSWSVTNGTITAGQSTNKITVRWNNNTNAGTVNVSYGAGIQVKRNVQLAASSQPTITGNLSPYTGSTVSYSTETGMSGYAWTVIGGTIQSGQNTSQISVKWDCATTTTAYITVNYINAGGCSADTPTTKTITWNKTNYTISGNASPNNGATEIYSISKGTGWTWAVTNGEILSGQNTAQVSVKWQSASGKLTVNYTNEYGCADKSELSVTPVQLFGGGEGTMSSPYLIKTAEQFFNIYLASDKYFKLDNDIDLTSFITTMNIEWEGNFGWVGWDFEGHLDGGYHTISGLWLNYGGLSMDNSGLFSSNSGVIEKLYVKINNKGIIGGNNVGGLVGYNTGVIYQCAVIGGTVTTSGNFAGGLVGYNAGTIITSYSSGVVVSGNNYIGGLAGCNRGVIEEQIMGTYPYTYSYYNPFNAEINQCYSLNTVVGNSYVGGLVGDMKHESKTVSYGTVTATATIDQSYASGSVEGGSYTSGLLGYNAQGTITGCYYDQQISKQNAGLGNPENSQYANIKSKYTSDMKKKATFIAWDFTSIWKIDETTSYPYFKWQNAVPEPPSSSVKETCQNNKSIVVYPNPTDGKVRIGSDEQSQGFTPSETLTIRAFDLQGKQLLQTEGNEVDLSPYAKGVYLLQVDGKMVKVVKK